MAYFGIFRAYSDKQDDIGMLLKFQNMICGIVGDPLDIDSIFRLDYGATPYGEETLTPAYSPYYVAYHGARAVTTDGSYGVSSLLRYLPYSP